MFDKIELVSVEERNPCGDIVIDEYLSHVSCGDGVLFAGKIDYWAEIPKWNH